MFSPIEELRALSEGITILDATRDSLNITKDLATDVGAVIKDAKKAAKDGNYDKAEQLYKKALKENKQLKAEAKKIEDNDLLDRAVYVLSSGYISVAVDAYNFVKDGTIAFNSSNRDNALTQIELMDKYIKHEMKELVEERRKAEEDK